MNEKPHREEVQDYQALYKELYDVVRVTIGLRIDKDRIERVIQDVVRAFKKDPYNPLLLYFYLSSEENYLISHIVNGVILTVGFGAALDLSEENMTKLGLCAFCHDFGMKEYTQYFQKNKELSGYEDKMIHKHPMESAQMFKDVFSEEIITAVEDIHEQVNGQGYPKGKSGSEISFLAKIVSICDVFEAMTHVRNSRGRVVPYEAIKRIIKQKDQIFDGKVVKRFVDFLSIYPVGSLVYLNTGELGMVVQSNYGYPTRSKVRILLTANHQPIQEEKIVNLLNDSMIYISGAVSLNDEEEILAALNPRGYFEFEPSKGETF